MGEGEGRVYLFDAPGYDARMACEYPDLAYILFSIYLCFLVCSERWRPPSFAQAFIF